MYYIIIGIIILTYIFRTTLSILNYNNRNTEIPQEVNDIYNEEDYKKWHRYFMEGFRFSMIVRSFFLIVTVVLLATKSYKYFFKYSEVITNNEYVQLGIFLLIYYLISFILSIPTAYYETFVIEEKYGFNKSTKKTFIIDKIKSLILTIIFAGGLLIGLFALYKVFENNIIMFLIYGWVGLVGIILITNMIYVKVIMPLFNKLTPLEEGELKQAIDEFANSVGYTVSKISVMDASKRTARLNAMFTGFGRFKHIILFDTLIEKLTTEEIVAVLAHEIGHNKHKHVITSLGVTFVQLALYFLVLMFVLTNLSFYNAFGFEAVHFGFGIIIFLELLQALDIFIAPLLNALIRRGEYQADHFAATKYKKEPMISALKVLTRENFSNLTPHPLFVKMKYSHPPVAVRIKAINNI